MPSSIAEGILLYLDKLGEDYARVVHAPNHLLDEKERELRELGEFIHSFSAENVLTDKTLVAIDGGRASQQLSGGDLIAVGATLADGVNSVPKYKDEPISEAYATIVPHTSDSETSFGARIMAALELRVLEQANTDYIIIDGAYLGNTSEVLFGLLSKNPDAVEKLLHFNEDGKLNNAMMRLLRPPRDNSSGIVAVPKSDSSFVQSKEMFGDTPAARQISDRKLTTHMLAPGEFSEPRPLETNPILMRSLQTNVKDLIPEARSIVNGKLDMLKEMGGQWDTTYENRLYTSYFKPSNWTKMDRALKIEFVYYTGSGTTLIDHTRRIVQAVNDDTVDNSIMEPYSQYVADRRAKEVSTGIDIAKEALLSRIDSVEEANGILRNYRT
jgi:hypothetical protein